MQSSRLEHGHFSSIFQLFLGRGRGGGRLGQCVVKQAKIITISFFDRRYRERSRPMVMVVVVVKCVA
jgi:hypothetical protein